MLRWGTQKASLGNFVGPRFLGITCGKVLVECSVATTLMSLEFNAKRQRTSEALYDPMASLSLLPWSDHDVSAGPAPPLSSK